MHDDNGVGRQLHTRVELGNGRIIPCLDGAKENIGQCRAVQNQLAGGDTVKIDHRHVAADNGRELHKAVFLNVLNLERHIRGAEGHGAGDDLLDAAARTNGLIVQTIAGFLFIGIGPFGIDRIGKGCASA